MDSWSLPLGRRRGRLRLDARTLAGPPSGLYTLGARALVPARWRLVLGRGPLGRITQPSRALRATLDLHSSAIHTPDMRQSSERARRAARILTYFRPLRQQTR